MEETTVTAIQAIQAILAPALGISAVALLLLGLMNRYSIIVNRIRLLNDEKRKFSRLLGEKGELSYTDNVRLMSITTQTLELLVRSRYVRNAILSLQVAIGLFVLTSVAIAVTMYTGAGILRAFPLMVFVVGMLSVFIGVVFSGMEVYRSYKIILLEVKGED
jgi:hypothetical protein